MALPGLAREIGRVSYGLLWVFALAGVLLWPLARFTDLITSSQLQYLAWVGWGVLALGFCTIMLDGPCRAAIYASNAAFQEGTAIRWPPRWAWPIKEIFAHRMGGPFLGILRLVGLAELVVEVALHPRQSPPLPTVQLIFCAAAVSTLLGIRTVAGPVFGARLAAGVNDR